MDNAEFLKNIERHRDQYYRFVLRTVWDSSMAEDVFSASVLAAYESRDRFIEGTNFRAWMFKILANKCFVANREVKRAAQFLEIDEAELAAPPLPTEGGVPGNPHNILEQCGDEVFQAFRRLNTMQRMCILLKDVEQFSYQEIAKTLDIPLASVMTHLSRGRTMLRRELLAYARKQGIIRNWPKLVGRQEGAAKTAGSIAGE